MSEHDDEPREPEVQELTDDDLDEVAGGDNSHVAGGEPTL